MKKILMLMTMLLAGCVGKPDNITPVSQFDTSRYLGKWYEIARLDHSFERGLKVVNRGYKVAAGEWKESVGKAYFVGPSDVGYLKVSFFGPFYGSYIVFDLDQQNYQYSMISGPDKSYLWILSRTPKMDDATKKRLVEKAQALGFDTAKLIYN
jgi:apolipoprotein D and lipocalin family protein